MSAVDLVLYGLIAVVAGGLMIWFVFYAFSGQTEPPSNLTEDSLRRLIGLTGRATSDVTELTGTVLVNSEEFSAKTTERSIIQKGTLVKVVDSDRLTLVVAKA